jgi:hypothetical protein
MESPRSRTMNSLPALSDKGFELEPEALPFLAHQGDPTLPEK